jgi:hypothetical protein
VYTAVAAEGTEVTQRDDLEGDVSGWTVSSVDLSSGVWEAVDPNGTIDGGQIAAPEDDATAGQDNVIAFVTQQGAPGGDAGASDVDGGPSYLVSPTIDLAGTDGVISFSRWFFCDDEGGTGADVMTVEVSNNGGATWVTVTSLTTSGTGSAWEDVGFTVSNWVAPTATVNVRFSTTDNPNNSVTEAGVDNLQVEQTVCGEPCPEDIDGDAIIGLGDLLLVLAAWGPCVDCPEDISGDGIVDFEELLAILSEWGDCP